MLKDWLSNAFNFWFGPTAADRNTQMAKDIQRAAGGDAKRAAEDIQKLRGDLAGRTKVQQAADSAAGFDIKTAALLGTAGVVGYFIVKGIAR